MAKNFLGEQKYVINDNFLFQDNHTVIRMETNGKRLCTGNSRHVHVRYFLSKIESTKVVKGNIFSHSSHDRRFIYQNHIRRSILVLQEHSDGKDINHGYFGRQQ